MTTITVKDGVEVITPTKESLVDIEFKDNICPIKECGQKFRNFSALRFHVCKSHGDKSFMATSESGQKRKYACPVKGCPRHIKSKREWFFVSLFQLKKHYRSIHAEKKYSCEKCGKLFGFQANLYVHEKHCQNLFYCSCGTYYTTKQAVQTHARRKGKDHNVVGQKEDTPSTSKETVCASTNVLIPAMLYIPKTTVTSTSSDKHTKNINKSTNGINTPPACLKREIQILPKPDPTRFETAISLLKLNTSNKLSSDAKIVNHYLEEQPTSDTNVPNIYLEEQKFIITKKAKLTSYEKNMQYLASPEAQNILSDPLVLCDTIIRKTIQQEIKKKNCKCKKSICKHFDKKLHSLSKYYELIKTNSDESCSGSLLTNTSSTMQMDHVLTSINTQTNDNLQYTLPTYDVLETSDFSMQCQFPSENLLANSYTGADNQTQTDQRMDNWVDSLTCFANSNNIETQTNFNTQNILTQTDLVQMGDNPNVLDKSIQFDDLWDSNTLSSDNNFFLTDSSNIGTQTALDENWLIQTLETDLSNEQNSMSTQTGDLITDFDVNKRDQSSQIILTDNTIPRNSLLNQNHLAGYEYMNLDKNNTVYSSSTQTLGYLNDIFDGTLSNTKSNSETQTAISFFDLLDTSFMDDYMNEERKTTSMETQTCSSK